MRHFKAKQLRVCAFVRKPYAHQPSTSWWWSEGEAAPEAELQRKLAYYRRRAIGDGDRIGEVYVPGHRHEIDVWVNGRYIQFGWYWTVPEYFCAMQDADLELIRSRV